MVEVRNVLCCSGLDPTGGAGIQADIEAIKAQGVHALALVTTLTVQDTRNVQAALGVTLELLEQQASLLLADCRVAAIKIGLLGDIGQVAWLAAITAEHAVPVVMDPILRAGGGKQLPTSLFADAVRQQLFPRCTLLTPNADEARRWTGHDDLDAAGAALLGMGVQNVLITGGDEPDELVHHQWHRPGMAVRRFSLPRWPARYHGAGCTLASTLAARLALGDSMDQAIEVSLQAVHRMLADAKAVGRGRLIPWRRTPGAVP